MLKRVFAELNLAAQNEEQVFERLRPQVQSLERVDGDLIRRLDRQHAIVRVDRVARVVELLFVDSSQPGKVAAPQSVVSNVGQDGLNEARQLAELLAGLSQLGQATDGRRVLGLLGQRARERIECGIDIADSAGLE